MDLVLETRIASILPYLDEYQVRIYLAAEAKSLGWGGVSKISELSKISRPTIHVGLKDLAQGVVDKRIRRVGGGRKKLIAIQPALLSKLQALVEPHTMGNPMNALTWTSKSLRKLQGELQVCGFKISHEVVRRCLQSLGFSLQTNKKTDEGSKDENRNEQFEYINQQAISFMEQGQPVISVDCKKKELVGNFKNNGIEWTPQKEPIEVKVYDFIDKELGKAVPYGVYDVAENQGFVNVGISADTAEFAANSIRSWWQQMGQATYPQATQLYINADGGGSNSSRGKLWKQELQKLANQTGLHISVSHFPPGTSKWNKIEHRLFSHISTNWRAKPLLSIEVVVNLIANTTTQKGLKVIAKKDENIYQTGIKVSKEELEKINIHRNNFRGEWNYTIKPNN